MKQDCTVAQLSTHSLTSTVRRVVSVLSSNISSQCLDRLDAATLEKVANVVVAIPFVSGEFERPADATRPSRR